MTRVLGICTRYCYHEATQIALRLANWESERGRDVTLFSTTSDLHRLDPIWDDPVGETRGQRFTDWAKHCSTVLWTHVPHVEQVSWCNEHHINTVVVPVRYELEDADRPSLQQAQWVLSLSMDAARHLGTRWGLRKSLALPYDAGLPFTRKDPRVQTSFTWVLLPLHDREPYKTENTIIDVAGRLLAARRDVRLTVLYTASTFSSWAKRRCSSFQDQFGDRMKVIHGLPMEKRPLLFRDHDVTLCAAHYDNAGITPLTSICMGTPVVAFGIPPFTEYLDKHNSVLVPCCSHQARTGFPVADPDYRTYEHRVQNIVIDRSCLAGLNETVLHGLDKRRNVFNEVLRRVVT